MALVKRPLPLLAKNNAIVVLDVRRTEKLEKIVQEIHQQGSTAEFKAVDVTDREDVKHSST